MDLGCVGDCPEVGFDRSIGLTVDFENGWPSARSDLPPCKEVDDNDFAAESCVEQFDMAHVNIQNSRIPTLSRWWILVAMVSLAFIGFFYLYLESLKSFEDVIPETADEQTQDMAKALIDFVRDNSPGR